MTVSVPALPGGTLPPQNLEAETSVLGSILLSDQALDWIMVDVALRAEDFYGERHRLIFRAMTRLKDKPEPGAVDALTVSEELDRAGELEEAGGTEYVHRLASSVVSAGHARHHARIVKDHSVMRQLIRTTQDVEQQAYSYAGDPRELVERAEAALFRITNDDLTGELRPIEDVLHDELDKLERISREGISLTGTPTGFKELDELTGGLQPGNLIVIAARPSMGKSACSCSTFTPLPQLRTKMGGNPVAIPNARCRYWCGRTQCMGPLSFLSLPATYSTQTYCKKLGVKGRQMAAKS